MNKTMKNKINFLSLMLSSLLLLMGLSMNSLAQKTNSLPSISLKDIAGKTVNTAEINNADKPIVICVMKTCCNTPANLLDEIAEDFEDWQDETGVELFIIATDDSRTSCKVCTYVNVREWEYKVLLDPNSKFKRALNVIVNPHIFILNKDGKIAWQSSGYTSELKDQIYQELVKL